MTFLFCWREMFLPNSLDVEQAVDDELDSLLLDSDADF
jgi:hypothetical protein